MAQGIRRDSRGRRGAHERRRAPRGESIVGRARVLVALIVGLAGAFAAVAWLTRKGPERAEVAPGPSVARADREDGSALESPPPSPERDTESGSPAPERFDGRGVIRGEVIARDGAAFPERWSLLLEPHPHLQGREKAVSRRLDFEHGESTFRVEGLPLGGYLVRASSGNLNDVPASVLLVRGSPDQFVTLSFQPSGFLDGGVLDAAGRAAEGLDVTLESVETRERWTVTTDASGGFLFRDVRDGEYKLLFGRPDSPLLGPQSVAFHAPSLRFPTRTLPETGSIAIEVVDQASRPQPQARLVGSAIGGSAIEVFADHLGKARVRFLLPGRYRVDATSEDGLRGSTALDLAAGQDAELRIVVRKRSDGG